MNWSDGQQISGNYVKFKYTLYLTIPFLLLIFEYCADFLGFGNIREELEKLSGKEHSVIKFSREA